MPIPSEAGRQRQRQRLRQRHRQSGNASICCTARAVDAAQECRNQNFNIVFCLVGGRMGRRPRHRPGHRTQQHQQHQPEACALWSCYFQQHSIATRLGQMPLLLLLFFFFLLPLLQCSGPKKRKSSTTNTLRNSIKRSSCYRGRHCVRELWFSSSEYVSNWRKKIVLDHYNDALRCRRTQLAICYNVSSCAFHRFNLHSSTSFSTSSSSSLFVYCRLWVKY